MPTFATNGPVTVAIDASVANIHLATSDRVEAVVEVLPTNTSRKVDVATAEQTRVEFDDRQLRITTPRQPQLAARTRSVDINIQVPTNSSVHGTASAGRFHAEGQLAG